MNKIYSSLIKRIVLPVADKIIGTNISYFYKLIKKMNSFSKDEILNWQNQKLLCLLKHAYKNTKYYNNLFNEMGLKLEYFNSIDDLVKIPILTKELIRKNYSDLIPNNINSYPFIKSATGGSTGDSLIFLCDKKSWSYCTANTIVNWERCNYNYGDKYIALGSTSLFIDKKRSFKHLIYYNLKKKICLSGINMTDQVCEDYVKIIKKNKIKFIYGYASSIYLLAKYVIESNQKIKIHSCFPTSEILTKIYRKTIIDAFSCKILDGYGAGDGGINAFEHEYGFFEVGYNSILFLETKNDNEIDCPVLLTDLFNYSMPLINYKIGDEVQIDNKQNENYSYNGQIINKVLGRTSDIIQLENGNILTGPGFTILFKDLPVEYYSIQKIGVNSIKCSIQKLPSFNKNHENMIIATFKKQFGSDCNIVIDFQYEVKLTKSGKRQYFITK